MSIEGGGLFDSDFVNSFVLVLFILKNLCCISKNKNYVIFKYFSYYISI